MFLTVSNDQQTIDGIHTLCQKYPNESVYRFDQTLVGPKGARREPNESLPTRITFLGHSGLKTYGGKNPDEFADALIKTLRDAAKVAPGIKNSLKNIDLIGCNNGNVSETNEGFTLEVASRLLALKEEGFDIRVSAFTNGLIKEPFPMYRLSTILEDSTFSVVGYRTQEDYKANQFLTEKASAIEAEKISPLEESLLKIRATFSQLTESVSQNNAEITNLHMQIATLHESIIAKKKQLKEAHNTFVLREEEIKKSIEMETQERATTEMTLQGIVQEMKSVSNNIHLTQFNIEEEIHRICEQLFSIHQEAVKKNSSWTKQIAHCMHAANLIRGNPGLDAKEKAEQIKQLTSSTASSIRKSIFGSPNFFGKGSTLATALEQIVETSFSQSTTLTHLNKRQEDLLRQHSMNQELLKNSDLIIQNLQAQLTHQTKDLLEEYTQLTTGIKEKKAQIQILQEKIEKIIATNAKLTEQQEQLTQQRNRIQEEIDVFQGEIDQLNSIIETKKVHLANTDDPRAILDKKACDLTRFAERIVEANAQNSAETEEDSIRIIPN